MSLKIEVYSDYVCPFCFLAKFPFEEAMSGKDVDISWLPFEGFHFANEHNLGKEYNNRIFKAFFQEDKNIGEIDILTDLAQEIGLNPVEFKEILVSRKYKNIQKKKALKHSYEEANISAIPTFKIGNTIIYGMRSKEEFEDIINKELNNISSNNSTSMSCNIDGKCL